MTLPEFLQGNQFLSGGFVLMLTGAVMGLLRQAPGRLLGWLKGRFSIGVTISDRDPLFEWTTLWLDSLPYSKRARRVNCALIRDMEEEFSSESRTLFTPAYGDHFFRHGKRLLWLNRNKPDAPTSGGKEISSAKGPETISITMLGTDQAAIRELIREIASFAQQDERRKSRAYISGCGWWRRLIAFQPRPLKTVDVPVADEQRIISAITDFLGARALYLERGIPYHLNFLFAGLPGTGKTSLASALCGHFGLNLHLLNIAGPGMNDERLVELMLSLPRRSMVLMEDVDAIVPERKMKPKAVATTHGEPATPGTTAGKEESQGVTLSGLLNCMDGITAPDGAVIVMTTNHPELIDPALLRPGRVDVRVNFRAATREQIERMAARLCPNMKLNGEASRMIVQGYTTAQAQADLLQLSSGTPASN